MQPFPLGKAGPLLPIAPETILQMDYKNENGNSTCTTHCYKYSWCMGIVSPVQILIWICKQSKLGFIRWFSFWPHGFKNPCFPHLEPVYIFAVLMHTLFLIYLFVIFWARAHNWSSSLVVSWWLERKHTHTDIQRWNCQNSETKTRSDSVFP